MIRGLFMITLPVLLVWGIGKAIGSVLFGEGKPGEVKEWIEYITQKMSIRRTSLAAEQSLRVSPLR